MRCRCFYGVTFNKQRYTEVYIYIYLELTPPYNHSPLKKRSRCTLRETGNANGRIGKAVYIVNTVTVVKDLHAIKEHIQTIKTSTYLYIYLPFPS